MSQFLFVSDLDNTFVGDDLALARLQELLERHRQEYGTKIVYATGRSPFLYHKLKVKKSLLVPDAAVTSVGTEIYLGDNLDTPDPEWVAILSEGWNRDAIVAAGKEFPELMPQAGSEQRPLKVSYSVAEKEYLPLVTKLESRLASENLEVNFVYSGGKDLDILPRNGNKGLAMQFLAKRWGISPSTTVACGDSGNDITLFAVGEERGIIVGNARSELLQWHRENPSPNLYLAKARCAGGILEGLKYFGFV
ncbi:MAG: sucrose-phosphate phosphatase [Oscillatoria sp. SIO1A7]|nr:sucrose-phosphate phosphatase [Oscillatoria sp. SIO1A7]